jgi:cell division protein FtsQ
MKPGILVRAGVQLREKDSSMTRERIELNGPDESPTSSRARTQRGGGTAFSTPDDREEISSRVIDLDLEDDEEVQFLRTQRRVPVRRGALPLPKKTAERIKLALKFAAAAAVCGSVVAMIYGYGIRAARFRIPSSDNIEISGVHNASRAQVMEIAGADIGRNVFFVPLEERRKQLERIPWVESASVMRLLPDRIAVEVAERTPVAKVQIGSKVNLIDRNGVVLGPPASRQAKFSFPVIHGITESEPISSRAAVMKIYGRLLRELDADPAAAYSRQISEVDLADPEDVKITVSDAGGTLTIHLGNTDFLQRYKLYAEHVGEWRKQYGSLESVDLRYEGQVVVNPDGPAGSDDRKTEPRKPSPPQRTHRNTVKKKTNYAQR